MTAQLVLYEESRPATRRVAERQATAKAPLCAACRAREARYGFRDEHDDPHVERPRTLCFECFRVEIARRQARGPHGPGVGRGVEVVAARMARGWNATQVSLPLEQKLESLNRRRRRAQIAARHALAPEA